METPRHDRAFCQLGPRQVALVLGLYRDRVRACHERRSDWEVHLFRNEGRDAGTSRVHAHAQLVTLQGPTPGRRRLEGCLSEYHSAHAECGICAAGSAGEGSPHPPGPGSREVLRSRHFLAATLWAPLDPYHLRIFPFRHGPSIAQAESDELSDLADMLLRLLDATEALTGGAAWNLLVHDHGPLEQPALHWHLEVRPRLTRAAGFEQLTGTGVCPSDPEADAGRLRAALGHHLSH